MSLTLRRHYPILIVLVTLMSTLLLILGDLRIIAYTTQEAETASTIRELHDYTNEIDLFDDTVVHSIQVIMAQEDYDSMITTYQETGLKEYFQADVILDGVRISNVGIRLKGNASLSTAVGGGTGFGGFGRPDGGNFSQGPDNGQMPEGFVPRERPQLPDGFGPGEMPALGPGQSMNGGLQQGSTEEVKIPFMIKFDEYEDQTYQGRTAIAIRNYGISYDEALLHEPITNRVAQLSGIPATETAYAGFRLNDNEEELYVVAELVNEEYLAEYFENSNGVLYKAELGSSLNYKGEDPSAYSGSFTQQTRLNDADLAPLIDFMRFLKESDNTTFESELPDYLDVDTFATYLAVNALLVNTDSMIGMNNNYYLYYDDVAEKFTVLMWDANESLGKLRGSTSFDVSLTSMDQMGPGGGFGMRGGRNALIQRFIENATFRKLYEEKLREVYQIAFAGGSITEKVDQYSSLIHSINDERSLVEITSYDEAVEKVLRFIFQRVEYLRSTELLSQ